MSTKSLPIVETLSNRFETYDRQKCFIAYSKNAYWSVDLLSACDTVLRRPEFDLEPDYAEKHFNSNITLKDKALELIANARYGIYDLSYWKDEKDKWQTPRNVFIELGMAIALNRPTLLLRHKSNGELELATCLQSVSRYILEFSGEPTLTYALNQCLPLWVKESPDENWWNLNCVFGGRRCEYRERHPRAKQALRRALSCHISDGPDVYRPDFRGLISEVLGRYSDLTYSYLDELPTTRGFDFLLCSYCQSIRAHPFAIHRLTESTQPETFIAIGISIALERQFDYEIPKLLLVDDPGDLPSLLEGYECVPARSDQERKEQLRRFLPSVMRQVRETVWKPRPLPFIEVPIPDLTSFEATSEKKDPDTAVAEQEPVEKANVLELKLDRRISELDLSVHTATCLTQADITTVRDLVQKTADNLRSLPNFARKNLKEVNRALNTLGLRLRPVATAAPKRQGTVHQKIRVYDLAKELKLDNRKVMEDARREGIDVSVPSNTVPHEVAERIRFKYFPKKIAPQVGPRLVKHAKQLDQSGSSDPNEVPQVGPRLVKHARQLDQSRSDPTEAKATTAERRLMRSKDPRPVLPHVRPLKASNSLRQPETTGSGVITDSSASVRRADTDVWRDHGTVVEAYSDTTFLVRTPEGSEVIVNLSGKMQKNRIAVLPGDTVTLQYSRREPGTARIVYRNRT